MIDLLFTNSTPKKAFTRPFFKKIIESAVKEVGLANKKVGLSINLVSKTRIQSMNKKYRNKNKPTDVLSFPLHNYLLPNKTKETILEIGDIFICPSVAVEKAQKNNSSVIDELKFLTVHGLLHLLGYDHEKSSAEKKTMFQLQDKILKKLK